MRSIARVLIHPAILSSDAGADVSPGSGVTVVVTDGLTDVFDSGTSIDTIPADQPVIVFVIVV